MEFGQSEHNILQSGLTVWGMDGASYRQLTERDDIAFLISHYDRRFKLRIHRPGILGRDEILSEHEFLRAGKLAGLVFPQSIKNANGDATFEMDGYHMDMLEYIKGRYIGSAGRLHRQVRPTETLHKIGVELAKLHLMCDTWKMPRHFVRPKMDTDGLLGENAVWGKFWSSPLLNRLQTAWFQEFRRTAVSYLLNITKQQDFGLILGGLVYEKILQKDDRIIFVNNANCCFGYRLFELAIIHNQCRVERNGEALIEAFQDGYNGVRPIDTKQLGLFQALRACAEVGLLVRNTNFRANHERNQRLIKDAEELTRKWMTR